MDNVSVHLAVLLLCCASVPFSMIPVRCLITENPYCDSFTWYNKGVWVTEVNLVTELRMIFRARIYYLNLIEWRENYRQKYYVSCLSVVKMMVALNPENNC